LVKKFREYPIVSRNIKVIKNANGIKKEAISDSLNQIKSKIVKNTSINVWRAVPQRFL